MSREELLALAERTKVLSYLKMVDDFCSMGTGEFIRNYPDCDHYEGACYLQRRAKSLAASLRAMAADKGEL